MIDKTDEKILYFLKRGKTNAYQVWKTMDKESNGNAIAYKNVRERFKHLSRVGIIEELPITEITVHGRKDYRISENGKEKLRQNVFQLRERILRLQKLIK